MRNLFIGFLFLLSSQAIAGELYHPMLENAKSPEMRALQFLQTNECITPKQVIDLWAEYSPSTVMLQMLDQLPQNGSWSNYHPKWGGWEVEFTLEKGCISQVNLKKNG
jgi:hypothetical protein